MGSKLIENLDRHARLRPRAEAIREATPAGVGRSLSWRELRDSAHLLATRLGPGASERPVLVAAPNQLELVVAILGGLWADATVVPASPELAASELHKLLGLTGAGTLIGTPAVLDAAVGQRCDRIPLGAVDLGAPAPPHCELDRGTGSILLQSSGTTGSPKVVRRRAAALAAVGENCRRRIGISESDLMLVAIPVYHSYGIDQAVLTGMAAGCTLELHERFDAAQVRAALANRGISIFPGVPVMFDALARGRRQAPAPALRRAYSAGSPLPRRISEAFLGVFGVRLGQIYGATEFGSVSYNDPEDSSFDPESVGRPFAGVEFRVLSQDAHSTKRPLSPGSEGQLAVAASSMFSEYVDDPGPATQGGFLLTGDLGRLDPQGRLRLTGRIGLLIDVGGRLVNPLEVEEVLARHPAVAEAIVQPITVSDTASRLKAIVVPNSGREISRQELQRFARQHLSPHKVPRSFEIRSDVPRSPTGKILRRELLSATVESER